jgi:hypothetical protein
MSRSSKGTTAPGFENRNGQVVVRSTEIPGTDHGQRVYVLKCKECGGVYGSNGSDIFQRLCPFHTNSKERIGRPGLPIDGRRS